MQILAAFAVIGVLLMVGGIVSLLTSGAGQAMTDIQTSIETFVADAKTFEAPGELEVELPAGGAIVALAPDGKVGDKQIGTPHPSVEYTVTIKGPDGNDVKFEANSQPRSSGAPFALLGFFETKEADLYKISATTENADDPHAAISVAAGTEKQVEALMNNALALLQGFGGGCFAACGVILALVCGIPALIMRKRKKAPDPLAQL